ncbi:MAG: Rieske (2Fe-2S) protein [Actinomycetota bacterium]|nr:Rieske (2Fe-2S) protein [Actinomycetota bacterium]
MAEERFSRIKFIRLGAALGVGAAGASLVAACGGGDDKASEEGETPGAVEGAGEATQGKGGVAQVQGGEPITQESDVEPGSALEFTDEETGQQAILVHLESGDFAAYSAICTHRQCTVGYSDGNLACPCHGSVFDPTNDGAVVNGPATQPLPEIPVEVRNGEVFRA